MTCEIWLTSARSPKVAAARFREERWSGGSTFELAIDLNFNYRRALSPGTMERPLHAIWGEQHPDRLGGIMPKS